MAWGDIPDAALTRLASERVRMFHAIWHFVRREDSWNNLESTQKDELVRQGWTPPRFEDQPGAGTARSSRLGLSCTVKDSPVVLIGLGQGSVSGDNGPC